MTITTNELEAIKNNLMSEDIHTRIKAADDAAWLYLEMLGGLVVTIVKASILDEDADVRNQAENALTRIFSLAKRLPDEIDKIREQVKDLAGLK